MRSADFSPTAAAARLFASRTPTFRPAGDPMAPTIPPPPNATEERWCEWPRRVPAPGRVMGSIWQTLQAIQARHA